MALYLIPLTAQQKLHNKAKWGIHLGLAAHYKAWLVLDIATKKLVVARDVYFYKQLTYSA